MAETIYNTPIVTNGSMSSNVTSPVIDLSKTDGYSVSATWTGSPVGTIKLQVSRDNVTFFDYPSSATAVSGPGNAMWEITTAFYGYVKLAYVFSSGSGTLNAGILGKGDLLA